MKKQTGFTLIELMVTMVILTILLSAAVPAMRSLFDNNNLKVIGPIFERSLLLARSEAAQRTQAIRISPKNGATLNDWSQGWNILLVTGPNANDVELLRTFDALPGDPVFNSMTYTTSSPLEISPMGHVNMVGDFNLNLAGCRGGEKYVYSVLLSGSVNRSVTTCP